MRTVKTPDVRRAEILAVANNLFQSKGYSKTAVEEIVRQAGIAKGTFYYYFKSKEDILEALTKQLVDEMAIKSKQIADSNDRNAIEKIVSIISQQNRLRNEKQNIVDSMHLPENRELHDRINIKIIKILGPILAQVIEQGNKQQLFHVDDPLSTIQFILAGSLFLFGESVFSWTKQEELARKQAMLVLIERTLGAKLGAMMMLLEQCHN
ncbi:TetR/AcrR family transcriptional regulator [Orbus wheelerorum]|uniref:TetR/AcrR family transcriptional regulator n=1 Tax=Orbus wheelerorum TaxID=3074111 RepID=UPI00370D0236